MEDLISRQAALDAFGLSGNTRKWGGDHSGYDTMMLYEIQDTLEDLPSVNQQKWIPVSERLPEENEAVLLGVRYKDDFKYFVTMRCDYNYWTGIGRDLKGIGYWMPLPEPYNGVEE